MLLESDSMDVQLCFQIVQQLFFAALATVATR
jgi:hypothetical protein